VGKSECVVAFSVLYYFAVLHRSVFQGSYVKKRPRPLPSRRNDAASVMRLGGSFTAAVMLLLSIFLAMQCRSIQ